GAIAKELRIRGHAELDAGVAGIGEARAAELESGAGGDGAFLDSELRASRLGRDLACHVINGREVRLARFFRRGSNANEDSVPGANCFAGIGGVGNVAGFAGRSQDLFKVFLVDRNAPRLELGDAVTINVVANDLA